MSTQVWFVLNIILRHWLDMSQCWLWKLVDLTYHRLWLLLLHVRLLAACDLSDLLNCAYFILSFTRCFVNTTVLLVLHWWLLSVVTYHNCVQFCHSCHVIFLADRTNGRAYATVLRLSSVCLSSVTWSIVAKRCVLDQKLLLRAYRKSYIRNRLEPKWMTLTFV